MLVTNIECFYNILPSPALGGLSELPLSGSSGQNDAEGVGSEQPFSADGKRKSLEAPLERQLGAGDLMKPC